MLRFLLVMAAAIPLAAQSAAPAYLALPADISGTLNGTPYRIRVPTGWNGTLLVYAHATASGGVEVAPPAFPPTSPTLEEQLLALGYALAGSFYGDLKDGPVRTVALANRFQGLIGKPNRTIVWGTSLGGSVALELIESYPGIFDAAIPAAPVAGGFARDADYALRYGLAYAAAFGWPSDWWGPIENLRDDLCGNEAALIMPVFQWATPDNYGQWEFIRLVMKLSPRAWWEFDGVVGLPGWALSGWKATALRSCQEGFAGGAVAQNLGAFYELTSAEKAYLATLGVNADELLDWMNARTNILASTSARNHVEHYGSPTGLLRHPVVMMHGIHDALLPTSHEALYRELAERTGHAGNLVQVYVNAPGHVAFSVEQFLATLAAIEYWLDTGLRPDASFFPESAGFDNSFVPPAWAY
jgi:pimeloyl-ACP methyl ester carboxylesterase